MSQPQETLQNENLINQNKQSMQRQQEGQQQAESNTPNIELQQRQQALMAETQEILEQGEKINSHIQNNELQIKQLQNQFSAMPQDQQNIYQKQFQEIISELKQGIQSKKIELQALQERFNVNKNALSALESKGIDRTQGKADSARGSQEGEGVNPYQFGTQNNYTQIINNFNNSGQTNSGTQQKTGFIQNKNQAKSMDESSGLQKPPLDPNDVARGKVVYGQHGAPRIQPINQQNNVNIPQNIIQKTGTQQSLNSNKPMSESNAGGSAFLITQQLQQRGYQSSGGGQVSNVSGSAQRLGEVDISPMQSVNQQILEAQLQSLTKGQLNQKQISQLKSLSNHNSANRQRELSLGNPINNLQNQGLGQIQQPNQQLLMQQQLLGQLAIFEDLKLKADPHQVMKHSNQLNC